MLQPGMGRNYQNAALRGHKFSGESLEGADFRGADLRAANFAGATLTGANFAGARCGVRRRWSITLVAAATLLACVVSAAAGAASAVPGFVATIDVTNLVLLQKVILPTLALLLLSLVLVLVVRWGFGAALSAFAAVTAVVALVGVLGLDEITATILILLIGIGAPIACIVILAIVYDVLLCLVGKRWLWFLALPVALVSLPAMWEMLFGAGMEIYWTGPAMTIPAIVLTGAFLLSILGISIYVGAGAARRVPRYAFVWRTALRIVAWGGTSFRSADLTDANFGGASMSLTDLCAAVLLRTNWHATHGLDRALVDGTYLARDPVRQLVVTKQGRGQIYDHLNLEGVDLSGADLRETSFVDAVLSRAALDGADLSHARLARARLYGADLRRARMTGCVIEDWAVATDTQFEGVTCDYIYLHLPDAAKVEDPVRKPDNPKMKFTHGDFETFIVPFVKRPSQYPDRTVYKTLDLVHHDTVTAAVCVIALAQLARQNADAGLRIVALDGDGTEKLRIQAIVAPAADCAALSAQYSDIYADVATWTAGQLAAHSADLAQEDARYRRLAALVQSATQGSKFYVQLQDSSSVRCLFLGASPVDAAPLHLDIELREITEALSSSQNRDSFRLTPLLGVRASDVSKALQTNRPHVVQFSAHATEDGELILLDDERMSKPMATDALRDLFAATPGNVRLVILSTCYAEAQAAQLTEFVDCVIGTDTQLSNETAIRFIRAFYEAIGAGYSVGSAFDQSMAAVKLVNSRAADRPRLLCREGVDPAQIFLITTETGLLMN